MWRLVTVRARASRFILGWICATSSMLHLEWHRIFGITKSAFVCHPTRQSLAHKYSSLRVHLTRGDGHLPLSVDKPRRSLLSIQITLTFSLPGKPTSISANSLCPPRSHDLSVQRDQQILGGLCGPDRYPSTLPVECNILHILP